MVLGMQAGQSISLADICRAFVSCGFPSDCMAKFISLLTTGFQQLILLKLPEDKMRVLTVMNAIYVHSRIPHPSYCTHKGDTASYTLFTTDAIMEMWRYKVRHRLLPLRNR